MRVNILVVNAACRASDQGYSGQNCTDIALTPYAMMKFDKKIYALCYEMEGVVN